MLIISEKTKKLPDCYEKGSLSNNNKLLLLDSELQTEAYNDIIKIMNCLDLNIASGKTLDLMGESVGQVRGNLTDEQYRIFILVRIMRNVGNSDYNSIINILKMLLTCNGTEVDVNDITIENDEKPATVKIDIEKLRNGSFSVFTVEQVVDIVNAILPATVTISTTSLLGTFEFGSSEGESDVTKGFGSTEDSTVGGALGLYIENINSGLPM